MPLSVHDIDPNFAGAVWSDHWEELRQRKSFIVESVHRTKRGDEYPVEIAVNHIEFGGREFNCAFARDISVRKRMERELWATQESYRILAEHVDDVIWTADMDLRWTYISPSMEKFRGYSAAETMSHSVDELLTPASAAEARTTLAEFLTAAAKDDQSGPVRATGNRISLQRRLHQMGGSQRLVCARTRQPTGWHGRCHTRHHPATTGRSSDVAGQTGSRSGQPCPRASSWPT